MDNAEWKPNMHDMQEDACPKKKKKSVAGLFAAVNTTMDSRLVCRSQV